MRYYSLNKARTMLGIDDVTLWRWMHKAHIQPMRDPCDWRRRRLSSDQVYYLAELHHRIVLKTLSAQVVSDLEARIDVLEREVLALSQSVNALLTYSDPLGEEERTASGAAATVETLLDQLRTLQSKQARSRL